MRFEKPRTRVAVLGEKLTPIARWAVWLTVADVMLHCWVRNAPRDRIPEKPHVASD